VPGDGEIIGRGAPVDESAMTGERAPVIRASGGDRRGVTGGTRVGPALAAVGERRSTGESAPVIRESGGDRSSVTGGTRVLSDWIIVRITVNPGESFLDRMIPLVED